MNETDTLRKPLRDMPADEPGETMSEMQALFDALDRSTGQVAALPAARPQRNSQLEAYGARRTLRLQYLTVAVSSLACSTILWCNYALFSLSGSARTAVWFLVATTFMAIAVIAARRFLTLSGDGVQTTGGGHASAKPRTAAVTAGLSRLSAIGIAASIAFIITAGTSAIQTANGDPEVMSSIDYIINHI